MLAAREGCSRCVSLLRATEGGMANSDGRTALMVAADLGRFDCVSLLLHHEAGMVDRAGRTALMSAAMNGHASCVSALDAEAGKIDADGDTALSHAVAQNRPLCVLLLAGKEKDMVLPKRDLNGEHMPLLRTFRGTPFCSLVTDLDSDTSDI
eukprot:gnl/Ergobibamus_cyprinoides/1072.p1 GENE.gnl/Ergobibamus_cyprinoides/1072~~gnl/Ergobibamus_cyprinoides/1072.p1  ORF type:complete len:152 (+),score=38.28 gnl/Ergobibamus_cyprinoides/1072:141-596(+)